MTIEVEASLITSIEKMMVKADVEQKAPQFGDAIKIKRGQFSGVDAVFYEADGDTRSIMLINNKTKVSIENKYLDFQ